MNRVRIVAITAVALGAAVTAGTKFQQSREAAMMQAAPGAELTTASVIPGTSAPQGAATAPAEAPAAPQVSLVASAENTASPAPVQPSLAPSATPSVTPSAGADPLSVVPFDLPRPAIPTSRPAPTTTIASAEPAATPSIAAPIPAPARTAVPAPVADAPAVSRSVPMPADAAPLNQARVLPAAEDIATVAPAPGVLPRSLPPVATAPLPFDTPINTDLASDTPLDSDLRAELEACAVWLVVTPAPGAMLETSVYAPCDGNAVVHLDHAGLQFDAQLGADGQLLAQIPALTADAEVTLTFVDGRRQSDRTPVADLGTMERVVLQWQAPVALDLNAYEFGAEWGDAGHVSPTRPHQPGVAGQGFLTLLGDAGIPDGAMAQVYSYPAGESPQSGRVALEIEVPVTDASCGRPVTASTLELHGNGAAQIRHLRIDMPDCDGSGGFIVVPGALPELQIALNQG